MYPLEIEKHTISDRASCCYLNRGGLRDTQATAAVLIYRKASSPLGEIKAVYLDSLHSSWAVTISLFRWCFGCWLKKNHCHGNQVLLGFFCVHWQSAPDILHGNDPSWMRASTTILLCLYKWELVCGICLTMGYFYCKALPRSPVNEGFVASGWKVVVREHC